MANQVLARERSRSMAWLVWASIAGAIAGVVFAMFEMVMAVVTDGSGAFFMPLRMIGGIGLGKSALDPTTSLLTAGGVGIVIHMVLSMMYGIGVAIVLRAVPALARSTASVLLTASAAGFALWVINFQVFARIFGWTWFPDGTNTAVQIVAHTVFFGTALGLGLIRFAATDAAER